MGRKPCLPPLLSLVWRNRAQDQRGETDQHSSSHMRDWNHWHNHQQSIGQWRFRKVPIHAGFLRQPPALAAPTRGRLKFLPGASLVPGCPSRGTRCEALVQAEPRVMQSLGKSCSVSDPECQDASGSLTEKEDRNADADE